MFTSHKIESAGADGDSLDDTQNAGETDGEIPHHPVCEE